MIQIFEKSYDSVLGKTAFEMENLWDSKAEKYDKETRVANESKRKELINKFLSEGIINQDSMVLDLGCGPGLLSREMSPHVKQVIGCDISGQMLDCAQNNNAGIDNVSFQKINWWDADIDQLGFREKFDLVIANMTPSIHDSKTLYKFMDCSKEYCFFAVFVKRQGNIIDSINNVLGSRYNNYGSYNIINILWLRECYPTLWYKSWEQLRVLPPEEALPAYQKECGVPQDKLAKLEEILEAKCQNGIVEEIIHATQVNMLWKKPAHN